MRLINAIRSKMEPLAILIINKKDKKKKKEYEKQYPHGIKGLYFKTAKEEFLAGKLLLGGFMGVDFQWRIEK